MDDESPAAALRPTAVARGWLEDPLGHSAANSSHAHAHASKLSALVLPGARVSLAEPGRVVCSFRVPATLTDADGRWHAGAVATAVDNFCSAVVYTVDGVPTFTVNSAMSFFSPASHGDEVELDGRALHRKGKMTAAVVEVRRKGSGELVAIGRQWMTPTRARPDTDSNGTSKL